MTKSQHRESKGPHLYDSHDTARFFYSVAMAEVVAQDARLRLADRPVASDPTQIAARPMRAHHIAATLITRFSALCKNGSKSDAHSFLEHQRALYVWACRDIDTDFEHFQKVMSRSLGTLSLATDLIHIYHGECKIAGAVLSFHPSTAFLAEGFDTLDDYLMDHETLGMVARHSAPAIATHIADHIGHMYALKAHKTLLNLIERDWKYLGAFTKAGDRFAKQLEVRLGAKLIGTALTLYSAAKAIKKGAKEIGQAGKDGSRTAVRLARDVASNSVTYHITPMPSLQVPEPMRAPSRPAHRPSRS
jgi:hypothetical protein